MADQDQPNVAANVPAGVELEPGTYWWCACGQSANQPWCDGSHKGSAFVPQKVEITERKQYWMCQCKHTGKSPFCDGSHKRL